MASKGQRWLVDSGILRKKNVDEEPQELLVFGYSCKLFRDDEKAKMIDQGKHLIPWMGDSTLKIDRCRSAEFERQGLSLLRALHSKMLASEVLAAERPSSKVRPQRRETSGKPTVVRILVCYDRAARYDGRGALADLRSHEPPSGGYDQRTALTEDEIRVEQICDEERYRSLYNGDSEDGTYHEEEMKRLHQALGSENTYGQVSYNYDDQDSQKALSEDTQSPKPSEGSQEEEDQTVVVPPELELPENTILPETQKLNAIITKTALFINRQGGQMEILIKAKQANNPQFSFLSIDGPLHPYYRIVLDAIKSGKYNPEKQPEKEETESEEESDKDDEPYLHPSLASSLTKVEAAPSIPSIQYKPSADCAYSMLVNKITGKPPPIRTQPPLPAELPPQTVQQPGYYPPHPPVQTYAAAYPPAPQQYSHGPVIYGSGVQSKSPSCGSSTKQSPSDESSGSAKEVATPLVPYGPTPPKPLSRPSFIVPPADMQIIIDKMASYVAKNGRDFEAIVKNKGDPRFNFLELSHQYHGYYAHKLTMYEGAVNPRVLTEDELLRKQEPQEEKQKKLEELQKKQQRMEEVQKRVKMIQAKKRSDSKDEPTGIISTKQQITTVSFSIKKPKDGDTPVIEKRSALPMEESDDDDIVDETVIDKRPDNGTKSPGREPTDDDFRLAKDRDSVKPEKTRKNEERELVDLTDDILEDCQKEIRHRQAEDRVREKTIPKDKTPCTSRERQLQLERKRKAAMFLSQIGQHTTTLTKLETRIDDPDSDEIRSLPSPTHDDQDITRVYPIATSLMNRLKSADLSGKRSRPRSRSRSGSRDNHSDRHRIHKKHKKKKSSHRSSHESPSGSSRSHKSKKSKKSSRHRSRSPVRRHQPDAKLTKVESTSSSDSSEP